MDITRKSSMTGLTRTLEVDCTPEQLAAWESGEKIQDVMPDVPAPLREFLMTGISPEEWTETFVPPPKPSRRNRT